MPQRIQLRRTKGWRKPEGAIVVARPSKWGNQFRPIQGAHDERGPRFRILEVGTPFPCLLSAKYGADLLRDATAVAVDLYRASILRWIDGEFDGDISEALADLRGHDLACWCPLDQPCHADVLLDLANREVS